MKPITWRGRLKRDMDETSKKFIDGGKFDDARKYMAFAHLMRKSIDIDWGFVLIIIGLSLMIAGLTARIVLRVMGYDVD